MCVLKIILCEKTESVTSQEEYQLFNFAFSKFKAKPILCSRLKRDFSERSLKNQKSRSPFRKAAFVFCDSAGDSES
jgi:hypothetical protein